MFMYLSWNFVNINYLSDLKTHRFVEISISTKPDRMNEHVQLLAGLLYLLAHYCHQLLITRSVKPSVGLCIVLL